MSAENGRPLRVDDIAALARHASMSSSYKLALLKAIVLLYRSAVYLEALGKHTDETTRDLRQTAHEADGLIGKNRLIKNRIHAHVVKTSRHPATLTDGGAVCCKVYWMCELCKQSFT